MSKNRLLLRAQADSARFAKMYAEQSTADPGNTVALSMIKADMCRAEAVVQSLIRVRVVTVAAPDWVNLEMGEKPTRIVGHRPA